MTTGKTIVAMSMLAIACSRQAADAGKSAGTVRPAEPAASPPETPPVPAPSVQVEYVKPTNPAHGPIYAEVQERRVLERLANLLSLVRFPKTLTLKFQGCDGDSNAYYQDYTTSIIVCYEFVSDIKKAAKAAAKTKGVNVTVADATDGPVVFFMLHETGHAVFDLLKVPVLGKEEDAADTFASLVLLKMDKEMALRILRGTAWSFARDARTIKLDESDYSDIHGLDAQRYYNLLCMAYGNDREFFRDAVTRGKLPPERARWCEVEYKQALFAMQKLVAPAIDQQRLERVRTQYQQRPKT